MQLSRRGLFSFLGGAAAAPVLAEKPERVEASAPPVFYSRPPSARIYLGEAVVRLGVDDKQRIAFPVERPTLITALRWNSDGAAYLSLRHPQYTPALQAFVADGVPHDFDLFPGLIYKPGVVEVDVENLSDVLQTVRLRLDGIVELS